MPNEVFRLTIVKRVLGEGAEFAEAIAVPEISALGGKPPEWRAALAAKAQAILEEELLSPTLRLHRRQRAVQAELGQLELLIEPPRRHPAWEQPVSLRVPFVRWLEGELHVGFVPALHVQAFATRANLLEERLEAHIRLRLAGGRRKITLKHLALLDRAHELELGELEVTVRRKTPKQAAVSAGGTGHAEAGILNKLAEALPPVTPRPGTADEAAKPALSRTNARTFEPRAYEMEKELLELSELLRGPQRRSVLLIGPPGCGKTALVRELAWRRREHGLESTSFWSTSGARLMTGEIGFGMWQERCQELCRELSRASDILHLSNLAELLEVGKASRGEQSVGAFLRPWLARAEVLAIAECTPEQLGVLERREPHLVAAFHPMLVPERTPAQTLAILRSVYDQAPGETPAPSARAGVLAALERLHRLHLRYATYSANPGRPVRFLRNALADTFPQKKVTEPDVIAAFARETGLPKVLLDDEMRLELEATEAWFARRIIGQPEASSCVLELLALAKARLSRPRKPLASLLFIGPTGTGKTEMAKALAEFLFSDPTRLTRFDLNEYSDPLSVQRLLGSSFGTAEGLLTARIREQPFSVLLLDEFEKADPSFFDLLLQILGEGRLTDGAGRVADFCNAVIVMTSNLGAQGYQRGPSGFRTGITAAEAGEHFSAEVRKFLRPEIFNRLDAIVPFAPLAPEVVRAIADGEMERLRRRDGLRLRDVRLELSGSVVEQLAADGYDSRYGARPLKRAIERQLLTPLAQSLNEYHVDMPLRIEVGLAGGKIQVHARSDEELLKNKRRAATDCESDRLAQDIAGARRRVTRLKGCSATSALENTAAYLESLERRLARSKWRSEEQQESLGRLPGLRQCLEELERLLEHARQLEGEALAAFYQSAPIDAELFTHELRSVQQEERRLRRLVFRLNQERPDHLVLAVFSEDRRCLLELVGCYVSITQAHGEVLGLDYFLPPPSGRSATSTVVRETPKTPAHFWAQPPPKLLGVVLQLRGDLIAARLGPEAGSHAFGDKKEQSLCLVETSSASLAAYVPPSGMDRAGSIQAKGAPERRRWRRERNTVEDAVLGSREWPSADLVPFLRLLVDERLEQAIERLAGD